MAADARISRNHWQKLDTTFFLSQGNRSVTVFPSVCHPGFLTHPPIRKAGSVTGGGSPSTLIASCPSDPWIPNEIMSRTLRPSFSPRQAPNLKMNRETSFGPQSTILPLALLRAVSGPDGKVSGRNDSFSRSSPDRWCRSASL